MNDNSYILMILGVLFLLTGIWMWKKDKDQLKMLEDRLAEKEESLYDLYGALEEIMDDMEKQYGKSSSKMIISQEAGDDEDQKEQLEYEDNVYSEKQQGYEDEEDDIENIVVKLKNAGNSEEEIARYLGIGKGEVKLILDIRKRQELKL